MWIDETLSLRHERGRPLLMGPASNPNRPEARSLPVDRESLVGSVAARVCNFLRRFAFICMCSLGEPVGCPNSSCSRPVSNGIFAALNASARRDVWVTRRERTDRKACDLPPGTNRAKYPDKPFPGRLEGLDAGRDGGRSG